MTEPTPPADARAFALFNEIGIIAQLSGVAFERAMPEGMTLAQFTMLNHFVRLGGPRSPLELARSFQVTKGAITNTMAKLAAKGLITVRPDPVDGRAKLVDITAAGRAMREACLARLGPLAASVATVMSAEDAAALTERLAVLRRFLDAQRDEDGAPRRRG